MVTRPARLVVLASGAGTTLQAVLDATADPGYGAAVALVVADREGTGAEQRARAAGVPFAVVDTKQYPDRAVWDLELAAVLTQAEPAVVVCAGFLRVLGPAALSGGWITVNTHPSLLPSFPGLHGVRQALAHGVKVSGVTVHVVDAGLDTGPILAQACVPVLGNDDEQHLRERIQAAERPLYVDVVGQVARGGVRVTGREAQLL